MESPCRLVPIHNSLPEADQIPPNSSTMFSKKGRDVPVAERAFEEREVF